MVLLNLFKSGTVPFMGLIQPACLLRLRWALAMLLGGSRAFCQPAWLTWAVLSSRGSPNARSGLVGGFSFVDLYVARVLRTKYFGRLLMHPVTIVYSAARVVRGGSHTSYSYADPAELLPPFYND